LNLIRVMPAKGARELVTQTARESGHGWRDWLAPLALVACLVAAWQAGVRLFAVPDYLLPAPSTVAAELWRSGGLLVEAAQVTLVEVVLGFLVAFALGLVVATVLHFSRVVRRALLPLLVLSQTVPIVVFAPLLTVALGYALAPKVLIVAVVCFFPIAINASDGFAAVEGALTEAARSLGAGQVVTFRRVTFPAALPQVFSGARLAATYAAVGAVFAEWAGSSSGLGFLMLQAEPALQTERIFAAVLGTCLIASALYGAVTLAERLLTPWKGRA
jgi:ABC-type nitrate/sulfonate/bicarbonate transport system permease component